jgi:hypothetical protein
MSNYSTFYIVLYPSIQPCPCVLPSQIKTLLYVYALLAHTQLFLEHPLLTLHALLVHTQLFLKHPLLTLHALLVHTQLFLEHLLLHLAHLACAHAAIS